MVDTVTELKPAEEKKEGQTPQGNPRLEQIKQEYSQLCMHAGHIQYQQMIMSAQLEELNGKRRKLDEEVLEMKKGENHV